jgi:hypothetical protein
VIVRDGVCYGLLRQSKTEADGSLLAWTPPLSGNREKGRPRMKQSRNGRDYNAILNDLAVQLPSPTSEYYAVTLTGDKQRRILRSVYSHWVGFADKDRRIEIRTASIVRAERAVAIWRRAGERCLVVNNQKELQLFFLAGGHAVIEKHLSESEIEAWLEPEQVVPDGLVGFTTVCSFLKTFVTERQHLSCECKY